TVKKQVGENDAIFGTVTSADVAEAIQEATNKEIDRRDIEVPDINKIGEYKVDVKLHSEVTATINLRVAPL
ncbi:MAG: 50S ribosomal protein L9, partial [Cyanobacteria bacterium P01_D01_bin.44]